MCVPHMVGDSGSPLLLPHVPKGGIAEGKPKLDLVTGILSFGDGTCDNNSLPTGFANVAFFREWIDCKMEVSIRGGKLQMFVFAFLRCV